MTSQVPLVIYHKNCQDGFMSAAIAYQYLVIEGEYKDVELLPTSYGDEPPDTKDRDVFVLDMSYPRDQMIKMHSDAKKMVVLDHHKTAQEDCIGLDFCIFNTTECGATLTWKFFYGEEEVPEVVRFVRDRDLWLHELPYTKEVSAALMSYEHDIEAWATLINAAANILALEGKSILRHIQNYSRVVAQEAQFNEILGRPAAYLNIPYPNASDVLAMVLEDNPQIEVAIGYCRLADGSYHHTLRSRSTDDVDVSKIAKIFGGGGHRCAAGFVREDDLVRYLKTHKDEHTSRE